MKRAGYEVGRALGFRRLVEPPFTIPTDGDVNERRYWGLFAADAFPSYEVFWAAAIVPLTYRTHDRNSIAFQTQAELTEIGKTEEDVTVAQLHYTVLDHLGRVFDLLQAETFDRYFFAESFVRLTGTSDVADELLQRRKTPGQYPPWDEMAGSEARRDWRNDEGDPLRGIRAYRNRLVHGRVVPELNFHHKGFGLPESVSLNFPRIEKVDQYLDWRKSQHLDPVGVHFVVRDFGEARSIVSDAWDAAVSYVETAWKTHLI